MKEFIGNKVLVNTDRWFIGKDGKQYKAVYGTLKAVHEAGETLGFIPNRSHANWFIEIGGMIIMGCQVLYFERCDDVNKEVVKEYLVDEKNQKNPIIFYDKPCAIYLADEVQS